MLSLKGRFVAYVLASERCFACSAGTIEELDRLNVQTGARKRIGEPCSGGNCHEGSGGTVEVKDIAVTSAGTIAWIVDVCRSGAAPRLECSYEVVELSARSTRLVQEAASTTIAPHSLAVATSRVYWTEAGQRRSAKIE